MKNVPRVTVASLRELGHDVKDIRGTTVQGIEDGDLWAIALNEARLLVTTDNGVAQYRGVLGHNGILIVRLKQPNRSKIHAAVMLAMSRFDERDWPGLLLVVRDGIISKSRAAEGL